MPMPMPIPAPKPRKCTLPSWMLLAADLPKPGSYAAMGQAGLPSWVEGLLVYWGFNHYRGLIISPDPDFDSIVFEQEE